MQDARRGMSRDKIPETTKTATHVKTVELKDKTIEEKRLNLALELRKL